MGLLKRFSSNKSLFTLPIDLIRLKREIPAGKQSDDGRVLSGSNQWLDETQLGLK